MQYKEYLKRKHLKISIKLTNERFQKTSKFKSIILCVVVWLSEFDGLLLIISGFQIYIVRCDYE